MNTSLIPCTLNDLDCLRELCIQTFTQTFGATASQADLNEYLTSAYSTEVLASELADPNSFTYFALAGSTVAGYLKLNVGSAQTEEIGPDALEVQRIYVLKDFKKYGIGRLFMEKALATAKEHGTTTIWLGVWEHNADALGFYRHFGFTQFGSHDFPIATEPQTDLLMSRPVHLPAVTPAF